MDRSFGILLHPTSLPSPFGIGDYGPSARDWLSILQRCGATRWQMCPLGPVGGANSPYDTPSSFAGNELLISPEELCREGLLTNSELESFPACPRERVDYEVVREAKEKLFRRAFERFRSSDTFGEFCVREAFWLDDYALFRVLKGVYRDRPWFTWEMPVRRRDRQALKEVHGRYAKEIGYWRFLQYLCWKQWGELRTCAVDTGVRIVGDVPYYVAYDSADVWAARERFELDQEGKRLVLAGVPPDYFSEAGQLWGNPLYRWEYMREEGYSWWVNRMRRAFELFDSVRIDHFRGFEAYWSVPAGSTTAKEGTWVPGPGMDFFRTLTRELGSVSIIAEDLGTITDEVRELRDQAGFPGMCVLQFAFDGDPQNLYLPRNVPEHSVMYTGTHDNNTSLGWFRTLDDPTRSRVCEAADCDSRHGFLDGFLELALGTRAFLCVLPLQDVLALDENHRFNVPGVAHGNWEWRCTGEMLRSERIDMVREMARKSGR